MHSLCLIVTHLYLYLNLYMCICICTFVSVHLYRCICICAFVYVHLYLVAPHLDILSMSHCHLSIILFVSCTVCFFATFGKCMQVSHFPVVYLDLGEHHQHLKVKSSQGFWKIPNASKSTKMVCCTNMCLEIPSAECLKMKVDVCFPNKS